MASSLVKYILEYGANGTTYFDLTEMGGIGVKFVNSMYT